MQSWTLVPGSNFSGLSGFSKADARARKVAVAAPACGRSSPTAADNIQSVPVATHSSAALLGSPARPQRPAARRREQVAPARLLFDPPAFRAEKLTVVYLDGAIPLELPLAARRYTLTHSDITGNLLLSVGRQYNQGQLSGWYIRLLRDEVLAEWRWEGAPTLHVLCHVSGQERWLAPPELRNYIFKREMSLVLDTLAFAERELLDAHPEYAAARVLVHMSSNVEALNCTLEWGQLGFRDSYRRGPSSMVQRILAGLLGWPSSWLTRNGASARRSLLESLDDSDDDFDGSPPFLSSTSSAPCPQEVPSSDANHYVHLSLASLPVTKPVDDTAPSTNAAMWSRGTSALELRRWRQAADHFTSVSDESADSSTASRGLPIADTLCHVNQDVLSFWTPESIVKQGSW